MVGDPAVKGTFMGPLISKQHKDKVTGYIDMAKEEGATIECGYGVDTLKVPARVENVRPCFSIIIIPESSCGTKIVHTPLLFSSSFLNFRLVFMINHHKIHHNGVEAEATSIHFLHTSNTQYTLLTRSQYSV